jgi:hypothetical protein
MTDSGSNGWATVLEEMETLAEDLEEAGWRTLTIPAGDAAAVTAETSRTGRHGFAYVVPGDEARAFEDLFVPDGFERTELYRAGTGTHVYLLTVVKDPPTETAILLAGAFQRDRLADCRRAALSAGTMYTDLFTVDGTHIGTFEHADPEPFFPEDT